MNVQTRSLSSSIVEFFRKPIEQSVVRYDSDDKVQEEDSQRGMAGDSREDMDLPDGQGSLILYETNAHLRPPVLPILPIQRLRLLRQKQELRRRLNFDMLRSIVGPQKVNELSLLEAGYSRANSSTPSPVKMASVRETVDTLKPLKSRKVVSNKRQGTKWSGEFDYDLSEYDNHSKEGKGSASISKKDQMDSPTITGTKSATLPGGLARDVNVGSLSAAQRDVLVKGQPVSTHTELAEKLLVRDTQKVSKNIRQEDKTVLPSIGFDFVKPDDTPSKASTVQAARDSQEPKHSKTGSFQFTATPQKLKQPVPATGPSFSFAAGSSAPQSTAEVDESEEPRRKKPAGISSSTAPFPGLGPTASSGSEGVKPLFSFGKGASSSVEQKEAQALASKPTFSFGKVTEASSSKKNDESQTSTIKSAVPSFSFGQKQNDATQFKTPSFSGNDLSSSTGSKPSFSFGKEPDSAPKAPTSVAKQDTAIAGDSSSIKSADVEEKQSLGSKLSNDEKPAESKKPAFSFGKGASTDKPATTPSFSFGANTNSDEKDTSAPPSFTFGKGGVSDKYNQPPTVTAFSFGPKAASEEKSQSAGSDTASGKSDTAAAPSFSFGASSAPDKKEPGTSSFTFGKKETPFSFNKDSEAAEDKGKAITSGTFSFGTGSANTSRPASANGFTFSRIEKPGEQNNEKPSFSFGGTDATKSAPSVFGAGAGQSTAAPTTAASGFSFNKPSIPNSNSTSSVISGQDNKTNVPSFGFKFGAGENSNNSASMPAAPVSSTANPFLASQNNSTFSFNMPGNTITTTNAPSSFGSAQPSQTAFGTTPSPAFGKSASPPVLNGSNNSIRAFTPSNTINMKFSNNASVNPSSIFSGGPGAPSMASATPQQVFGGTPPPTQVFGAGSQPAPQFGNTSVGFGTSDGIAAGQLAQPAQQAPMPNFQLPPGRKLARMRQSRR